MFNHYFVQLFSSICSGDPLDYFLHERPVYGLSIDPINDNVFASACDDGRVLIYDIREPPSTGRLVNNSKGPCSVLLCSV
jgi:WD40 repeat protein